MEETTEKSTEAEKHEEKPQAVAKKDPFSLIGKLAVAVVILALLIGGGIYLGMTLNKNNGQTNTTVTPSVSQTQTTVSLSTTNTQASPTVMKTNTKTITAGLGGNATSFKPYSIEVPAGWTESRDKTDITDKLTLTKGTYSFTIYQAPMGGGGCLYPGDADVIMAQRFTQFAGIDGASGNFRRSWNDTGNPAGKISYTYCQYGSDSFGTPTSFGAISAISPDPAEKDMLIEINSMVTSLKKQ